MRKPETAKNIWTPCCAFQNNDDTNWVGRPCVYGILARNKRMFTWFIRTKKIARPRRMSTPSSRFQLCDPCAGKPDAIPRNVAEVSGWSILFGRRIVLVERQQLQILIDEFRAVNGRPMPGDDGCITQIQGFELPQGLWVFLHIGKCQIT